MPGFDEACVLAHERKLLGHVGIHVVLTEGEPLTEGMRRCRRFCDGSGRFADADTRTHTFWLSSSDRRTVSAELRAQVDRCRRQGLPLTHMDSHHHVHTDPAIGPVVNEVARQLRIPHVRLARNCGAGISLPRRLYKMYFNTRLARAGLAHTRYFGEVADYVYLKEHHASPGQRADFEVMTHPIFDDRGDLIDSLAPEVSLRDLVTNVDDHESAVSFEGARVRLNER
jgi:chitin disaccharide deacetylase